VLAVLAYSPDDEGVAVEDLELTLPRDAAVVQRGIERTRPGEPLDCAAPVALVSSAGRPFLGLGVSAQRRLRLDTFADVATGGALGAGPWLGAALQACRGRAAFSVMVPSAGGDPSRVVLKETE